ncbi:MAG: metallopeptidase TldD-related protein [Kofleriaceae bacterium]|nr:metallopeptidase TldD-related protein [Kofleriaceae bacterium]
MISRRALVDALSRRRVAEWTVIESAQEIARVDEQRPVRHTDTRTRWTVLVHHDVPQGRGSARIEVTALDANPNDLIEQAIELASVAVGPVWRSTPPAAPAKVDIFDPTLARVSLLDVATSTLSQLKRPADLTVGATLELVREQTTVQASSGFSTRWPSSTARASFLVASHERSFEVVREARRIVDLDLATSLATAATDLQQLAAAAPTTPGRYTLALRSEALLHGGGLGLWSVFAERATADVERAGLLRYRLGAPIAPAADQLAEPITITSDGTLDFGLRSAPVGDDGDAIRRFALVERGVAVGLGTSMREAARRGKDPNGGIRNLVVTSGTWNDALPSTTRSLDVRRLRSLAIDPYTGDANLEIGLAIERDGTSERAVTGGILHLDLVAALARARRSATPLRRGAYLGPGALLLEDVEVFS